MTCYGIKDGVEAVVDFMIWKADHHEAISMQKLRALGIVGEAAVRSVLTTIQFNDKIGFKSHEIHDVRPDRLLAAEFEAGEFAAA